jgi:hypothetical protein
MRNLILVGLGLCATTAPVAAQNTEIIIRRPGQQDQVIRLDEKQGKGAFAFRWDSAFHLKLDTMRWRMDSAMVHWTSDSLMSRWKMDTAAFRKNFVTLNSRVKDLNNALVLRSEDLAKMGQNLARRSFETFRARPIIGVTFDSRPRETDKYGVFITGVSPGGPADKAGIRAGDVITRIGGKSLTDRPENPGDASWSLPAVRLIEIVAKLQTGKTVEVSYRRGNDSKTVKLTPTEDENLIAMVAPSINLRMDSMVAPLMTMGRPANIVSTGPVQGMTYTTAPAYGGRVAYAFGLSSAIGNLELAPLNEKLGAYFGTSEGVLVINTGDKDAFGLQPGDVIAAIDGRKVTEPAQFMRALRSYSSGESFKLQVMRNRKTETLDAKLP